MCVLGVHLHILHTASPARATDCHKLYLMLRRAERGENEEGGKVHLVNELNDESTIF